MDGNRKSYAEYLVDRTEIHLEDDGLLLKVAASEDALSRLRAMSFASGSLSSGGIGAELVYQTWRQIAFGEKRYHQVPVPAYDLAVFLSVLYMYSVKIHVCLQLRALHMRNDGNEKRPNAAHAIYRTATIPIPRVQVILFSYTSGLQDFQK
jgi:hypothetical protein